MPHPERNQREQQMQACFKLASEKHDVPLALSIGGRPTDFERIQRNAPTSSRSEPIHPWREFLSANHHRDPRRRLPFPPAPLG